ncbi:MAG: ABC transporter permease [Bryobacteraceae bacterium]|jgi:predicted permease
MLRFTETLWKDVRYALRLLIASPAFTLVAVLSLALGIGANTALFSVMDALILRMLPVKDAAQLVRLRSSLSFPAYEKMRDQNQSFDGLFAYNGMLLSVSTGKDPEQAVGFLVAGNYFSALGVRAALGRLLTPEDDRIPGAGGAEGPVAVISYQYWERRFARDPSILGRTVILNGIPVPIVGVSEPDFYGVFQTFVPDITVPMMLQPRLSPSVATALWTHGDEGSMLKYDLSDDYGPQVMGRLKPGVSMAKAQAELNVFYQQILAARAGTHLDDAIRRENAEKKLELQPAGNGSANFQPQQRALLLIVALAVPGVVLLIACANVANLLLARAAARQKEVAVRLALGAGRSRLVRQFLTESLLLALVGGAVGLLLAGLGRQFLLRWMTSSIDFFTLRAETDWRVVLFTLGVSVLAALVFGVAPAFRSTNTELAPTLKEGARGSSGGRGWETGKVLVAAQVALSLLLLATAGLLIRTVQNIRQFDPGFSRDGLYAITTNFFGYKGPQTGIVLKQIWEPMASLPGAAANPTTAVKTRARIKIFFFITTSSCQ